MKNHWRVVWIAFFDLLLVTEIVLGVFMHDVVFLLFALVTAGMVIYNVIQLRYELRRRDKLAERPVGA